MEEEYDEEEYIEDDCIDSGISIKLGKRTDSFEMLERLCKEEAENYYQLSRFQIMEKFQCLFGLLTNFRNLSG